MSIEWYTLLETARRQGPKRDPLQDPLEGADWQELGWAVRAIAALVAPRGEATTPQKYRKPVVGPHMPDAEGRICV